MKIRRLWPSEKRIFVSLRNLRCFIKKNVSIEWDTWLLCSLAKLIKNQNKSKIMTSHAKKAPTFARSSQQKFTTEWDMSHKAAFTKQT